MPKKKKDSPPPSGPAPAPSTSALPPKKNKDRAAPLSHPKGLPALVPSPSAPAKKVPEARAAAAAVPMSPLLEFLSPPLHQVPEWPQIRHLVDPRVYKAGNDLVTSGARIARFLDAYRSDQFLVETEPGSDAFCMVDMSACVCSCNGGGCPAGADPYLCPHIIAAALRQPVYRPGLGMVLFARNSAKKAAMSLKSPIRGLTYEAEDEEGQHALVPGAMLYGIRSHIPNAVKDCVAPENRYEEDGPGPFLAKHWMRTLIAASHALVILTLQGVSDRYETFAFRGRHGTAKRLAWWREETRLLSAAMPGPLRIQVDPGVTAPEGEAPPPFVPLELGTKIKVGDHGSLVFVC